MKRKMFKITTLVALVLIVVLGYYASFNIHTVVPNEVYRSAELPSYLLKHVVKHYHIQSIINLRNSHPEEKWYRKERKIAKHHHIQLFDMSLPAFKFPAKIELSELTQVIKNAPKPILIHCRYGADRTGLASSIAIILNNGSWDEIASQVSWKYGAVRSHSVGKLILEQYASWLMKNNLNSSAKNFELWVNRFYKPT